MTDENEKLRQRLADLETEVATLKRTRMPRGGPVVTGQEQKPRA